MRVFVAGATGAIGRQLVPLLVERGHEVTGMTRTESKLDAVAALGATSVLCDAFDRDGLIAVVGEARPDVVVHQLTEIPKAINPRKASEEMAATNRLRREGTRNLVAAALVAGAGRMVAQSIAFAYAPAGRQLRVETDPLHLDARGVMGEIAGALDELERVVTTTDGLDGVVLRYGFFYGPGTAYAADGSSGAGVRANKIPLVGGGTGVFSFIHVADAATATAAAVEGGGPGIYNVVDDDPAPVAEWLPAYAEALGAKPPRKAPAFAARLVAGRYAVALMTELEGASNEKAKRELGWEPQHPSWRQGFVEALG